MRGQHLYIQNKMNDMDLCPITLKSNPYPNDIDTTKIRKILKKSYISAQDMKAISCLFQSILTSNLKIDTVPILGSEVNKWIKSIKKLSSGGYGEVLMADVLNEDINIVIKRPLQESIYEDILREYFIGITRINNLRYYVPNFVYTLGAFHCGNISKGCNGVKTLHIVYEKIHGKGFYHKMIQNRFEWFLRMFVQILLALEVAQREISFSHYDLHTLNVMIKEEPINYTVLIDNVSYEISTQEYPVIIDFGRSCVDYDGKSVGAWGLEQLNIFPFCTNGVDVGNFLYSAYLHNNIHNKQDIVKLAGYLGIDINRITGGSHFNITPLNALISIISNKEYRDILSGTLGVKERDKYLSIQYDTVQNIYSEIFREDTDINKTLLKECIRNSKIYSSYIFANIVKNIIFHFYPDSAKRMTKLIEYNKDKMVHNDMIMLEGYQNIYSIPPDIVQTCISLLQQSVTRIHVDTYFNPKRRRELFFKILDFRNKYNIFEKILPYLDQVYMIRWQGIDKEYATFLQKFKQSQQYKDYLTYKTIIIQTFRWIRTLEESIEAYK